MDEEIQCLTRGLAACDEAAWTRLHGRYFAWLMRRVRARGVSDGEAPEVVQRVYLRVMRHARVFDEAVAFESWLGCLVRCEVIDAARRIKRRTWLGERFQQWQEARGEAAEVVHLDRLQDALCALPAVDRHLVSRHYIEGWSQEELAAETGCTVKAVESKLARLRMKLRKQLTMPEQC